MKIRQEGLPVPALIRPSANALIFIKSSVENDTIKKAYFLSHDLNIFVKEKKLTSFKRDTNVKFK